MWCFRLIEPDIYKILFSKVTWIFKNYSTLLLMTIKLISLSVLMVLMYLFTGWTNRVRNLTAEFVDNYTIKLSWEPPEYDGGVPVHYYKLILYDLYDYRYRNLTSSIN